MLSGPHGASCGGRRYDYSASCLVVPSSLLVTFLGRTTDAGRRRVFGKSLLPAEARCALASRRRTTKSVKSSPGGQASAKSSTAPSVEKSTWFALAPLTASAAEVSLAISNSSSRGLRHSVSLSEYASNISPGFRRTV